MSAVSSSITIALRFFPAKKTRVLTKPSVPVLAVFWKPSRSKKKGSSRRPAQKKPSEPAMRFACSTGPAWVPSAPGTPSSWMPVVRLAIVVGVDVDRVEHVAIERPGLPRDRLVRARERQREDGLALVGVPREHVGDVRRPVGARAGHA